MKKISIIAVALATVFNTAQALDVEMRGSAGIEARAFFDEPAYPNQSGDTLSLSFSPEFYYAIPNSSDFVSFYLHSRVDSADEERSHVDLREFSYLKVGDGWELKAGVSKVFWGVTEGQHLVDIINQTDLVENLDGEDKLGQPMVNLTLLSFEDLGVFDFFILPGFRERTFPGEDGRLRSQYVVDTDNAIYEAGNENLHTDAALRWSHSIDIFDIGVSHFWGTSRDPSLLPTGNPVVNPLSGQVVGFNQTGWRPFYPLIHQTGLDLQASLDGWLLKLELISREGKTRFNPNTFGFESERYTALATGFEYTLTGFMDTNIDLGLISEWNYDDRQKRAPTTFQNDVLLGTRWAFNNADSTEILIGLLQDLDYNTTTFSLEGSTRLTSNLKLTVEGRIFAEVDSADTITKQLEEDGHIQAQLDYFF